MHRGPTLPTNNASADDRAEHKVSIGDTRSVANDRVSRSLSVPLDRPDLGKSTWSDLELLPCACVGAFNWSVPQCRGYLDTATRSHRDTLFNYSRVVASRRGRRRRRAALHGRVARNSFPLVPPPPALPTPVGASLVWPTFPASSLASQRAQQLFAL